MILSLHSIRVSRLCLAWFIRLILFSAIFQAGAHAGPRTHGGVNPPERIANLRRNIERFDWARAERDKVTTAAAQWAAIPDEQLWKMVLNQNVPRTIDVTWDYKYDKEKHLGCLKCGDAIKKHGNYPYNPDFWNKPWKLTCPSCGVVFPTNDFGKYYESGLDEHGLFQHNRADKALLFNTEHPDPADPLHKYGVDDGFGYKDENGRYHKFIGYYTWKYWRHLQAGLQALAQAYLYTGDPMYARKAGILLDRIADVYPDIDWAPYAKLGWYHSDGSSKTGKIEGSIWEAGQIANVLLAYDAVLSGFANNSELLSFLQKQAATYKLLPKGTHELLLKNIDDNLVRTVVQAIHEKRIFGNFGMRQRTMVTAALALNQNPETDQWIDWCFDGKGGQLTSRIISDIDRDGFGNEAAPGYALSVWISTLNMVGELIANYPQYKKHNLYRDYPNFLRMFTAGWRLLVLDWTTPNIGDTGATGLIQQVQSSPDFIAKAWKFGRDHEAAIAAYHANGGKAHGILRDIFAEDPDATAREIAEVAASRSDAQTTPGFHMPGFGLASLEQGSGPTGKALWLYYGRNGGHGHQDQLNIGLYGFGLDLTPDLGYPEFAGSQPERKRWVANTIAHNLVVVDRQTQQTNWTGYPRWLVRAPGLQAVEVEAPNAYPQTSEYSRTAMLVEAPGGNAYVVDLFSVSGGDEHLLSFHGPPGTVVAEGLEPIPQTGGTYAGPDVPFGVDRPDGFSFLTNVERTMSVPHTFTLDWAVEPGYRGAQADDHTHLRMHVISHGDENLALADGAVPQNKAGNPKSLRYALMQRTGKNLQSNFFNILEPYQQKPFITQVVPLFGPTSASLALQINHGDLIDYIICKTTTAPVSYQNSLALEGTAGLVRTRRGKPIALHLLKGTRLAFGGRELTQDSAEHTGQVLARHQDMNGDGELWVDAPLPEGTALAGELIIIENDRKRSACYEISHVARETTGTRISCGAVSFVRGLRDPQDASKGYLHDFAPGARFTIPRHQSWVAEGEQPRSALP